MLNRVGSAYRYARMVADQQGKSVARQFTEIARARRANPTLGASDYYWLRLYDDAFVKGSSVRDFLGWRVEDDISQALNPRHLMLPAWDKFSLSLFARAYALPVPKLHAVFKPGPPLAPDVGVECLATPDALAAWLRHRAEWPLFAKPSCSRQSLGCYHFVGYDAADDSLLTKDGKRIAVPAFVAEIVDDSKRPFYKARMGYLFQEVLRAHADIASLLGTESISGVRAVVLQDEHGPELISAFWKMASGANVLDAFAGAGSGTYLGSIDCATGRVGLVVDDWWPKGRPVQRIAATDRSVEGFVLPQWDEVKALCRRVGPVFPLMRLQHWDIAITDRGPLALEVNDFGALSVVQIFGKGLLTDRLRAALRASGEASRFPWIGAICS